MLDKHSCEMFYTQKLPSKVSQGDTKMRVDLHHGMYGVPLVVCWVLSQNLISKPGSDQISLVIYCTVDTWWDECINNSESM